MRLPSHRTIDYLLKAMVGLALLWACGYGIAHHKPVRKAGITHLYDSGTRLLRHHSGPGALR